MAKTKMIYRILKMYESMNRGREIQKASFCEDHEIGKRTFERDIEKIRLFLSEEHSGREVLNRPDRGSYYISGNWKNGTLSFLEIAFIVKILKSDQTLEKSEFEGIVWSLQSVTERGDRKKVKELLCREMQQYEGTDGKGAFLKLFGDLLKCISDQNIVQLQLKGCKNEKKRVKFFPVAVEYQLPDFYLLGYQPEREQGLVAFMLDEIDSFQIMSKKYNDGIAQSYSYQEGKRLLRNYKRKGEKAHEAY